MKYNRTLSNSFSGLIEIGGELRWLYDFVKSRADLDFLIGKQKEKEWISVYRGLTRILTIFYRPSDPNNIKIDAAKTYKGMVANLFGIRLITDNFQTELEDLLKIIAINPKFNRYYKNEKEGYYQNELSRQHGICGSKDTNFVIIDKEAVIGYENQLEKDVILGPIRDQYKQLQKELSINNPKDYGSDLTKKSIGNELDFLALDKEGNILLIEYKHGTSTSGIYLSPLQIGLYYDIFTTFPRKDLELAIDEMFDQKQKIGLINPNWVKPKIYKDIIPVLIISEYNSKSTAKDKFDEILRIVRGKKGTDFLANLRTYNFTLSGGLSSW